MGEYVLQSLPLAIFFLIGVVLLGFTRYLKRYRTDLESGKSFLAGESMFAELNVFNPKNYNEKGQGLLKWAWGLTLLQLASLVWAMASWN